MIQMDESRIDYFPIKRALSLKDKQDEEDVKLDELKSLVQRISDRLAPLEEDVKLDELKSLVQCISDRLAPLEELVRRDNPAGASN